MLLLLTLISGRNQESRGDMPQKSNPFWMQGSCQKRCRVVENPRWPSVPMVGTQAATGRPSNHLELFRNLVPAEKILKLQGYSISASLTFIRSTGIANPLVATFNTNKTARLFLCLGTGQRRRCCLCPRCPLLKEFSP